jgi:hypothetical protein
MIRTYGINAFMALFSLSLAGCGGGDAPPSTMETEAGADSTPAKLLIVGQDLGAIRGYMASDCCPQPDGLTAYLDFYDILKDGDFGGLGIDADGSDSGFEFDWDAGPVSALRTATEFGVDGLAIGLSITENEHPGGLQGIVDGDYDAEILQLAKFAGLIRGPIYLRIGYEFDGAWNEGYEDAEKYIAAWHRIVDVLRDTGVSNIEYVWQASASTTDDVIDGGHDDITQWYPGDDYVDWMAFSWFMNPHETVQVESAYEPLTPLELTVEVLDFARERGKPVMIAEAAPQAIDLKERFMAHHVGIWDGPSGEGRVEMTDDAIWDFWFQPTFDLMSEHADIIHALAYINADWDSQAMWGPPYANGFWGDTRLEVNEELARRFTDAVENWRTP